MAMRGSRVFGILIVVVLAGGLAGFGTRVVQGGRTASIGTVDGLEITTQEYANAYQQQARQLSDRFGGTLTAEDLRALGLDRQVLSALVAQRSLDAEASRLGLSVGDARVAAAVRATPAFQGISGGFDRDLYRDQLNRNDLSETDFEDGLRRDSTRTLLQAAILSGLPEPVTAADTLAAWQGERRTVTWAEIDGTVVAADVPVPDAAALQAWYDAHPDSYTSPETRRVAYAWATPERVAEGLEVDDAEVRALYDERRSDYVQEERRLVERLVLDDQASAEAAEARIESGETDFEAEVEARDLRLSDVDLGDVSRGDLGEAADAIFAATPGDVLGPLPSQFGPAIYRVNAVLAADEIPFEEAETELRQELAADDARAAIGDAAADVDDLVAGGASVTDLASQTLLQEGALDFSEGTEAGPAAYASVRDAILAAEPGDLPTIVPLEDGGLAVIAVEEVIPPALRPFDEVQAQVTDDATRDAIRVETLARAEAVAEAVAAGASFEDQGLAPRTETSRTRRDVIEGAPQGTVAAAFQLSEGGTRALPSQGGAVVIRVDAIEAAPEGDPTVEADRAEIARQLSSGLSQELFGTFSQRLQLASEVRIDDGAVAAVNAQIQ